MTNEFDRYLAPASTRQGFWRLFVGIGLIVVGWLLWTVLVLGAVFLFHRLGGAATNDEALAAMTATVNAKDPTSVIVKLATFAGIWPATWAALRFLHGQRFGTLLSVEGRMRWGDFLGGLTLAAGFWVVTMIFGLAIVGMPTRTDLPLGTWLLAFAPLAVMVFLQASAEELIFRGYILQQLASRWRSPLVWAFLPAFLFGLAHYSSGSHLGVGWHYVVVTLLFGLAAATLVWRTGSLAAAMGVHTGMNLFALSGIGLEGVIEGTQLFLYDNSGIKTLFLADGVATFAILIFVLSPLCPFRARALA